MKLIATILSTLLGLAFAAGAVMFLLGKVPQPVLKPGSNPALFMGIMGSTGYMTFVKTCELLGGILLAIPKTRNFGLLLLCPIIANIMTYDVLIQPEFIPLGLVMVALALFLVFTERAKFLSLLR